DHSGRYLAGVECDGASYHRSATARDRDRLREWVLTDLGWTIRRIWSTEWWMNAAAALEKLHARLEGDLESDRAKQAQAQNLEPAEAEILPSDEPEADERGSRDTSLILEKAALPAATNDRGPIQEVKIYARSPEIAPPPKPYVVADLATIATPEQARFYDRD